MQLNLIWRKHDLQSVNEYLVIEIAATDVWVPITDARIDVAAKKHVNMFLSSYTNETTETTKILYPMKSNFQERPDLGNYFYPMACCVLAKSNIFLMTWWICNCRKMNAKHVKAKMTTNIPITIGIQRNLTSIFALNLVSKFENNQVCMSLWTHYYRLMYHILAVARLKSMLSCYGNFSNSLV